MPVFQVTQLEIVFRNSAVLREILGKRPCDGRLAGLLALEHLESLVPDRAGVAAVCVLDETGRADQGAG